MDNIEFENFILDAKSKKMNCDQCLRMINEFTNLYSSECNILVQQISKDIWKYIFDQVNFKYHDYRLLLQYRLVCKLWNNVIKLFSGISVYKTRKDITITKIPGIFCNLTCLKIDRVDFVTDENLHMYTNLKRISISTWYGLLNNTSKISLLTNLNILSVSHEYERPYSSYHVFNIEYLANLTKLKLDRVSTINNNSLALLTNLKCLKLKKIYSHISDDGISSLTNLTSISLYKMNGIRGAVLLNLPNLTNINGDEKNYFQKKCIGKFKSGFEKYIGEWLECKAHGFGKFYYNHSLRYEGNWHNGTRHGTGRLICTGDPFTEYIGEWQNDMKYGYGELSINGIKNKCGYWIDNNYLHDA